MNWTASETLKSAKHAHLVKQVHIKATVPDTMWKLQASWPYTAECLTVSYVCQSFWTFIYSFALLGDKEMIWKNSMTIHTILYQIHFFLDLVSRYVLVNKELYLYTGQESYLV